MESSIDKLIEYCNELYLVPIMLFAILFFIATFSSRYSSRKIKTYSDDYYYKIDFLNTFQNICICICYVCLFTLFVLINKWFSFNYSSVSDFGSIFEISFGLNIIFYLFNLLPNFKLEIDEILNKINEQEEIIKKEGGESVAIGFSHEIKQHCEEHDNFSRLVCWSGTIFSLLFLLVSGFFPQLKLHNWILLLIVILAICPILLSVKSAEYSKRKRGQTYLIL